MLVPISVEMSKHSIRSGIVSSPSACWRPSSASTRCWRRRSERSRSWSRASLALRSASSRIRRLSPRSAARISTVPSRRALSASASAGRVADLALDDQQRRDHHRAGVVLEDERLGHLGDPAVGLVVEVEALAVGQHAVADLEDLGVGLALVHGHRDRVERADGLVGHPLALEQRVHRAQPVALPRGILEALLGRRLAHRFLQRALDLAVAAGQEVDHAVDPRAVVLAARRSPRTGPRSA